MELSLTSFMIYTLWAVYGLLIIDFLFAAFQSFWVGSFSPAIVSDCLKGVLYYVFPLYVILITIPMDPTGWILAIFYFVCGFGVMLKYAIDIKGRF
ncbi:hypothetical protein [Ammoniphilus resinae]|uniref:Uncharacterized protein n=1 Tax=Ammoniphilus resinae TaxID=861532 RepID=A0ABS4GQN4_9BACL|nr:hypothetical protein [Ammoniphilus resinae]MBP1932200.1 hypothetical protein [Ammoniphilus resinae]